MPTMGARASTNTPPELCGIRPWHVLLVLSTVNLAAVNAGHETISANNQRREDARRYLEQERAFRVHAVVAACSLVVIVAVNAFVNAGTGIAGDWWAWWSLWAVLGWGIGIAIHGTAVRLARHQLASPTTDDDRIDALLASVDQPKTA